MPELVGGVKGAPGKPNPPRGPCSSDRFHCASISSLNPSAAGSNAPAGPGNSGCLKGPPRPGKLAGPVAAAAAAAAAAVPAKIAKKSWHTAADFSRGV